MAGHGVSPKNKSKHMSGHKKKSAHNNSGHKNGGQMNDIHHGMGMPKRTKG